MLIPIWVQDIRLRSRGSGTPSIRLSRCPRPAGRGSRGGFVAVGLGGPVHVPHPVLLHQRLRHHQALGDVPPLVFKLHDGLGVPVERRHRGAHAGAEGAPRQAEQEVAKKTGSQ